MPRASARVAGALLSLALLGAASPSPSASGNADAAAVAMLRASVGAPRNVSYVGQLETIRFSSSRANAAIVRIEHRAPDLTRRWYLAPESAYGDYIVSRGDTSYEFDTKHAQVTVTRNLALDNAVASDANLTRILANYRPVAGGNEIVAGHQTTALTLMNKYTGEPAVKVWLDTTTHLVLKKEEYHGDGSVASKMRFDELRYTQDIPGDVFSTAAPAGYTQVAGRDLASSDSDVQRALKEAGFKPANPHDLPQGFALTSGAVTTVSGVKTLQLVYSDGLRSISLFQNDRAAAADFGNLRPRVVRFENHDAQYVEDGPTTLLTWKERGLAFALVGDLSLDELVQIARSVVA